MSPTAYSLVSSDFGKLRYIFDLLTPGLVFVNGTAPFAKALDAVMPHDAELVTPQACHLRRPEPRGDRA